ncbi:hypothetical protein EXIGLDRAFT_85385 [Exidia glandulosa HHB12029]|uniref:Secreted protein n=1 Tax=Exidia glandulosa HHB12029 TaxID=1314781 RepID=A0A166AHH0_EXIGL|nr:hypothetical protein EXIGLDRAFT_85385 [Exidia glandulosa HHB12029]
MSFFSFSKLVHIVLSASSVLGIAFNPQRFSITTCGPTRLWDCARPSRNSRAQHRE